MESATYVRRLRLNLRKKAARRRQGRGPALWLSSLLVCSECGSNYVQYGRTDYVCSGFYNGSTCPNGIRFRIADIEREVLAALELDLLSPATIQHATNLAMEYFDKQRKPEPEAAPALTAALAEIDKRESDVREQFKSGKLPGAVFKSWLGEFMKEREALNHPSVPEMPPRLSRSEFIRAYRSAVERKLDVFTKRENVALSREALRTVLAEGNLILRPDVANARVEGTLTISREEFLEEKQIDIKLVAGACFEATKTDVVCFSLERILEPIAIPGICGNGHLLTPDNLKVDQAKRRWRCRRCGRARAAEFRARHKLAA